MYVPNEDDKAAIKDKFWEDLMTARGIIFMIDDFNSRVGKQDEIYNRPIEKQGEDVINNNGRRMLDFYLMDEYVLTNTLFEHKNVRKYTWEVTSRGEISIIDFVIVENKNIW